MNLNVPLALKRRIDGYQSNIGLVESGRKLVCDDIVVVQGFPDVPVSLFENWAVNPLGSRSWQWAIAAFRFVPALIAYHASSGDAAALDWAFKALRSWQKAIKGPLKKYEFASNDHAVANQAENLVFLLAYLSMHQLRPEEWKDIASSVHRHADLLSTEKFYSRHTNHGIEQSRILAVIADFFSDDERSEARLELAVERLSDELGVAFTKEGVHVENSPGYHAYVCLSFLKILDYFPRAKIEELADRIDTLMPRAMRFLVQVSRPDGTLPILGDTVNDPVPNYFRRYQKTRDFTHLRYVITDGAEGSPSPQTTALYPQAGYFVARDAWYPPGQGSKAFHLIFRCGYRSRYHRHDDDLSLVLYCDGEDWLIDSGAYNYSEQDPLRKYMRSKWAHNVPVVLRTPEHRWTWKAPSMALPVTSLPSAEGSVAVRGVSHSYPGHLALRDLHVNAGSREFTVVDSLIPVERHGRRRYLSLWHLPGDKDVQIDGQQVTVTSRVTGRQLFIRNIGRPATTISLVDPGVDGILGAKVSWFSNKAEPAHLLAFEWAANALQATLRFNCVGDVSSLEPSAERK